MIETKLFEVRDRMTYIPVMATKIVVDTEQDRNRLLLIGTGYWPSSTYFIVTKLDGLVAQHSAYRWGDSRTMSTAHTHIAENWDTLVSGSVIDVQYILGETTAPVEPQGVF